MPQGAVAELPHETLAVRHLTLGVIPLQDGDHLGQHAHEVAGLDGAVLLELGDEAHERGGVGRVLSTQLLELCAEQRQGELARPELLCGRVADEDLQLVQEVGRRHRAGQGGHLEAGGGGSGDRRHHPGGEGE